MLVQGLKLALSGVAIGLLTAFALTKWMETLLFGVRPTDPLTFTVIAVGLMLVALLACWVILASSFSQPTSSWCGTRSPLYDEPSGKNTKRTAAGSGDGGRAYKPHMILMPLNKWDAESLSLGAHP